MGNGMHATDGTAITLRAPVMLRKERAGARSGASLYLAGLSLIALVELGRHGLGIGFGQQQGMMTFLPAIILSAYLGGLGVGLLATFAALVCTGGFLIVTSGAAIPALTVDWVRWGSLMVSGVLVSLLSEVRMRTHARAEAGRRLAEATLFSMTDALIAANAAGTITLFNPAAEALTGWRADRAIGLPLAQVLRFEHPPAGLARALSPQEGDSAPYTIAMEQGLRLLRAGGGQVVLAGTVVPLQGEDIPGVLVVLSDCSEQLNALAEQRASEALFRDTFEQAAVGMAHVAPDGRWLRVNRRLCDMLGYQPDELGRLRFQDITHPDDVVVDESLLTELLAGQRNAYSMEKRYLRRDGSVVWGLLTAALIRAEDGRPSHFVSVVEDIQQRKLAEQALAISEERCRLALDAAELGNWRYEVATDRLSCDTRAGGHFGAHGEGTLSLSRVLASLHAEDQVRLKHVFTGCGADLSGESVFELACRIRRGDGEVRWIAIRGMRHQRLRAERSAPLQLIGTTQDVTERRSREDEIRRLNASLEYRVAERTAELQAANQELESFAYAVSHDLRAPLRAMNGFSEALIEDFGPSLVPEAQAYLQQIMRGSQHMGTLIDGLLALSRITRGDVARDPVDLSDMAARIVDDLRRDDPAREVDVKIEPGLHARGDARMLEAALRNLLGNAWKYTGQQAQPRLRVSGTQIEGVPCYTVADNGAGFDMAHAAKLFQPFQRLHRVDEFPGIGIGLATVQRVIQRHGGHIWAESTPGAGAQFHFTLGPQREPGSEHV